MRRLPALLLLLALVCAVFAAPRAYALAVPPNQGQWVVDTAKLLPPAQKNKLGAELRRYAEATGNQIVILTVPGLQGEDIAGYANRVAREWGVGQKDRNNGVLILVSRAESRIRFEVGRGIEDKLPDLLSKRIQREVTVPHFKAGRFAQGLEETVQVIEQTLTPAVAADANATAPEAAPAQKPASRGFSWLTLGLLVLAVVLVFALFHRRGGGGGGGFGGPGGYDQGDGRGSSFLMGMLLGLLSSRWRGGGGGFGGGMGGGSGGDGGFSGGGGDFGGGGSDSGFGGGDGGGDSSD